MIESLYPVKRHHMDQVLTHSRTLPEAPASNLGHPCTYRFLCSCWKSSPPPDPGEHRSCRWEEERKKSSSRTILHLCRAVTNVSLAELSCSKLGIWLVTARILNHHFPTCIRAELILSLHLIWYFFHIDDLRGANHSGLLLAKSQQWRTAQHKSQHTRSI